MKPAGSAQCLLAALAVALGSPAVLPAKPEGVAVRTIYLIRHGMYDYEDERDPDVGKGLVPLGVAQARLVAHRLRALPVEGTSLHTSTMRRARETAQVVADELPFLELQASPLLRECTPPTWRQDIMEEESPADLEACREQLDAAFGTFFTPSPDADRQEILVSHGNAIRYLVTRVLKVDPMSWLGMSIGNCSLTVVKVLSDGSMKLLSFSDVGHIPPGLQTRTAPGVPRDLAVPRP